MMRSPARAGLLLLVLSAFALACGNGGRSAPGRTATTAPETSVCLPGETRAPVLAACRALAAQFDADPGEIELVSLSEQQWPDSCLGAPKADEACDSVITPGFQVVLKLKSKEATYTFNTDAQESVRLAGFDLHPQRQADVTMGEPELVVRGAEPVAFDFAPDGRLFYTERQTGEIKTVAASANDATGKVFAKLAVYRGPECGLLGIVVDPNFTTNRYIYIYVTQPVQGRTDVGKPRLIRYTDVDGTGQQPTTIIDDLPLTNDQECAHVSGNVHFGRDGMLYISVGNFERPPTAANLSVATGKFLRVRPDGSAAPDNPFVDRTGADKRIFAYGFRNPWDFAFDPDSGVIYAPDNGPGNCDELNIVRPGADYGVPGSLHSGDVDSCLGLGGTDPIYLFARPGTRPEQFGSNVAPAGVAFLSSGLYPNLGRGLLVCEFVTNKLRWLELTGSAGDQVGKDLVIATDCVFNVEVSPDGIIYYSNGEGIWRLPPAP